MFLKTLEAQGFKSFPDKTVLTFEKGITAVVGPNGSGKSNIADAISWVLGEQSTKQLRGEKMEDVIFNGTAKRNAQGMASVTICFDNKDRSLSCDSDEVYITRKYYRSGESRYEINHSTVRLKDINELFMDTGVGRDGYSMIGQGKISDIVGKRSDERRDMFEEAAGISRYRYRKSEAQRKLSAAEDNLVRLRDIFSELEGRVGPLEKESKKAKSFIEYSEEKKRLEIGLWLIKLNSVKEQLDQNEQRLQKTKAHYGEIEEELENMNRLIEAKINLTQEINIQIDEARRASSAFEEQAAVTDGQASVAKNNIFHLDETAERIKKQVADALSGSDVIDSDIESKRREIEESSKITDGVRRELEISSEKFEALVKESGEILQQSERISREIADLQLSLSESELKGVTASSSIDQINDRCLAVDDSLKKAEERKRVTEEEFALLSGELEKTEELIKSLENSSQGIMLLIKTREKSVDDYKIRLDDIIMDSQTKKRRAAMLEEMEQRMEEFNHSVRAVIRDASKGILGGIRGPVSRLIKVDGEYAVAIETALSNAMQNIVVENENDAKRAIELLKKNKEGRATFLPLTAVKRRVFKEDGLDDCFGFVGIASELVRCDKEYSDVISSLLGAVVVAEDLDSAVLIAKKYSYRFKIVTLDGQIVNAGGSMTGGALVKNAGVLGRATEIEKLKKQADELDAKAKKLSDRQSEEQNELAKLKAEYEATKSELLTAGEEKIRFVTEIKRVQSQSSEIDESIKLLQKEKSDANQRIEEFMLQLKSSQDAKKSADEHMEKLSADLKAASKKSENISAERDKISEYNSTLRVKIVEHEKDVQTLSIQLESLVALKNNSSEQLKAFEKELEDIVKRKDEESGHIESLESSAKQLRLSAKECADKVNELILKRDEAEKLSGETRAKEKELLSRREQLSSEIARLSERSDSISGQTDSILSKLFEEYELTKSEAVSLGIVIEDQTAASKRLSELKNKIRAMGSVNVGAIEEYKEVKSRFDFMKAQIDDVEESKKKLLKLIDELTGTMQQLFIERFNLINENFSHTFVELFGGGLAQLTLSDPIDVLNSGIEINVQPPGKKVSSIEQLSGGEKSLVAIAIYFAMMKVAPPPFCMLDEVESALDDINVDRFANYLRKMSDKTQFVIVTHRRGSMEEADVLYGVTMQEKGVSKLLQLNLSQVEDIIK